MNMGEALLRILTPCGRPGEIHPMMDTYTDFSPSAAHCELSRFADPTRAAVYYALRELMPDYGHALAIASGGGAEISWLAEQMPWAHWLPTDADPQQLRMLAAYVLTQNRPNLQAPRLLDVHNPCWPLAGAPYNLIYCSNLLHKAPRSSSAQVMRGAALLLTPGGALVTRGPFLEDEVLTSAEHLALDDELQAMNTDWGLRRREDLEAYAARVGLELTDRIELPEGELLLVWEHASRMVKRPRNMIWL
jgi:hypothetical protein